MRALVLAAATALLLSACSTAVDTRMAMPSDVAKNIHVTGVEAIGVTSVSPNVVARLMQAVQAQLARRPAGTVPVGLRLNVNHFKVVSGGARFMIGAFGGANTMWVGVEVSGSDGAKVAEYDIKREANPGGYGVFYDQEQATIDATAEGIVQAIYGEQ